MRLGFAKGKRMRQRKRLFGDEVDKQEESRDKLRRVCLAAVTTSVDP